MLSPERRAQIEQAKNNTPSSNEFIWVVAALFFFAWLCREDLPIEVHAPSHNLTILGFDLL